jgi:CrcB protein
MCIQFERGFVINSFVMVGVGAAFGAWLRWGLGLLLNHGVFPIGTLIANLLGGYLMGFALAISISNPSLSPATKLLITTGFLGGLTTFSTFSAEAFTLLQKQLYGLALMHLLSHVIGSILFTAIGFASWQYLKSNT